MTFRKGVFLFYIIYQNMADVNIIHNQSGWGEVRFRPSSIAFQKALPILDLGYICPLNPISWNIQHFNENCK